jgi:hypothetical protein
LSPPKKGKDLSALKARLAKKAVADAPAVPAPGEVPAQRAELPAPGEAPPAAELPAPGQAPAEEFAVPPSETPTVAAPPMDPADFEPTAGAFDAYDNVDLGTVDTEIKQRGSLGLLLLASVAALSVGLLGGYLVGVKMEKGSKLARADAKSGEIAQEINATKQARARVSLGLVDVKKAIATDPAAASDAIGKLAAHLETSPNAEALFGWQTSYMDPKVVKRILRLYREGSGLRGDIAELDAFVKANGEALKQSATPLRLAVLTGPTGAKLVEAIKPLCGTAEAPAECTAENIGAAFAYQIRESPGAEPIVVPKEAATALLPEGPIFKYAIMDNPARSAYDEYARLMASINTRLETMNKVEKHAIKAFEEHGAGDGGSKEGG